MEDAKRTDEAEVQPGDFLRAILKISPEDAEKAREQSPATRKRPKKQEGPTADYGEDGDAKG